MGNCCGGPQGPVATTTTTITTGSGRPRTSTDRVAAASRSEARQQRQAQIVESERLASERGNLPLSAEPLQWKSSAPVKKAAILKRRLEVETNRRTRVCRQCVAWGFFTVTVTVTAMCATVHLLFVSTATLVCLPHSAFNPLPPGAAA
eukprot:m.229176 g.229176  ORF g.229176 m.229176 type:complete len:148 (+) comp18836_c2_seq8:168-611(+)